MESLDYWIQYNVLRRHATGWGIDYARYTHVQLRHAIELNNGVADASLRARLLGMPPVNAYHAAISSDKTQMHKPTAIQKADPLLEPFPSSKKSVSAGPAFSIPAPKEAFPWTSASF